MSLLSTFTAAECRVWISAVVALRRFPSHRDHAPLRRIREAIAEASREHSPAEISAAASALGVA